MEDEDRPLVHVEPPEGPPDEVVLGQRVTRAARGRHSMITRWTCIDRNLVNRDTPAASKQAPARVQDDPPEPNIEPRAIA
jgi:hypothetical protein